MDDRPDSGDSSPGCESKSAVSPSTAFELLARRPRRHLLQWVHRNDDRTVSLDDLVRRLTESDVGDEHGLRVALHHVHLPKLDAADVVDYDAEAGEVRYLGDPVLADLLECWIREEDLG